MRERPIWDFSGGRIGGRAVLRRENASRASSRSRRGSGLVPGRRSTLLSTRAAEGGPVALRHQPRGPLPQGGRPWRRERGTGIRLPRASGGRAGPFGGEVEGMMPSILVVADEPTMQEALGGFLQAEGYHVATTGTSREALTRIEEREFDVIVADMFMPGVNGFEILERSRSLNPAAAVVLMACPATVERAAEAIQKAAREYLMKPFPLEELRRCLQRRLRDRSDSPEPLSPAGVVPPTVEEILVGESSSMRAVRDQIFRCAPTPSNVLITGESGTGK